MKDLFTYLKSPCVTFLTSCKTREKDVRSHVNVYNTIKERIGRILLISLVVRGGVGWGLGVEGEKCLFIDQEQDTQSQP